MAETLTAGEALIALRATSDKLSADMAAASKLITGELAKVEKSSASIDLSKVFKEGLAAATAFAGGVGVVATAATKLALSSVKTGDEINRMSQAFGISAEELSGLKMAAEDVDVRFGQVQVGLKTLANQAADAAAGNEAAARTFEALGIAVTDANGNLRPTGDLLADVADKMAAMQDGAGKTAIATQLLGRSGQDLIPVLNGGSAALRQAAEEAKGLGVAFDTEAAAAAAALDDQLDKLGHQIGGVANEIGQSLMPIVSDVVREVSGWIDQNRTLIGQSVEQWVTGVKVVIEGMIPIVRGAARAFNDLGEAIFGATSATGIAGLTSQIQKTNDAMQELVSDNKFWWLQSEATTKASEEYKHLELTLASLQQQLAYAKGEAVAGAKAFGQLAGDTDKAADSAGDAAGNFGKLPPPIIATGDAAKKTAESILDLTAEEQKLYTVTLKTGATLKVTKTQFDAIKRGADAAAAGTGNWMQEMLRAIPAGDEFASGVERAAEGAAEAAPAIAESADAADEWSASAADASRITSDLARELTGLIPKVDGIGGALLSSMFDATVVPQLNLVMQSTIGGALQMASAGIGGIAASAGGALAGAVGTGFSAVGSTALEAVIGTTGAAAVGAGLGSAAVGAAVLAGVGGIGLGIAAAFGAFDGPDMQHRISHELAKMVQHAFDSPAVHQAVDAALTKLGFELTSGIERTIANTPISGAEVRATWEEGGEAAGQSYSEGFRKFLASEGNGINNLAASDLVNLYFPGLDEAGEAAATEAAKMAGAAAAAMQGLTGQDALIFAEQFGASLANVAHVLGMTDEEFLQFVEDVAGKGAVEFAAGLDSLNAAAIESLGPGGFQGLLDDVESHMATVFGVKNIDAGNLLDIFVQSGASAEAFAAQLERMADSDPALRRLIDSMDPPLVDALAAVEDGGNAAAKAIGKLTGQANTSLAGVEARIYAFGDALFEVAEDGSKQLSTLGEELNSELVSGISGIEDAIKTEVNSAAGLTSETLGKAFSELQGLAALPAEALDDSTTAAIEHLKAVIQAATGWTAEQIDTMIATATAVPPPVQPVPPETTASLDGAAESTGEIADNSAAAATAADDLTSSTQATGAAAGDTAAAFEDLATRALAALGSLIGAVGDDAGLLSIEDLIRVRIPEALAEAEAATLGATGVIHDSFDYARGAVLMYTDSLLAIPTEITTTITRKYVTEGDPGGDTGGGEGTGGGPGMAAGGWIPGLPGDPYPITAHGGELVVPEATASTLPPDLVARLLSGSAFDLPASMVSRLSYPVGVPSMASVAGAGAAASTPALDSEWTALPVRKRDLIEGAVLEVARATETGRARIDGRRFRVSPTYGSR